MDHDLIPDESGQGSWIVILGCPRPEAHILVDEERTISGPSFALCADCAHQRGSSYEARDPDADWSAEVNPERLDCGFSGELRPVKEGHQSSEVRPEQV